MKLGDGWLEKPLRGGPAAGSKTWWDRWELGKADGTDGAVRGGETTTFRLEMETRVVLARASVYMDELMRRVPRGSWPGRARSPYTTSPHDLRDVWKPCQTSK